MTKLRPSSITSRRRWGGETQPSVVRYRLMSENQICLRLLGLALRASAGVTQRYTTRELAVNVDLTAVVETRSRPVFFIRLPTCVWPISRIKRLSELGTSPGSASATGTNQD